MKTKYSLLGVILLFFCLNGKAQKSELLSPKIQFGFEASSFEMQLKPYLFEHSKFSEQSGFSYDLNLLVGIYFKKKWYSELGISYSQVQSNYKAKDIIPLSFDENSNTYQVKFENSWFDLHMEVEVSVDESACLEQTWTDEGKQRFSYSAINRLHSFGIPIAVGRVFGAKKMQYFIEFALHPSIYLKKDINNRDRFKTGLSLNAPYHLCSSEFKTERIRPRPSIQNEEVKGLLNGFRLDGKASVGIIHTYKSSSFKLALFYGESISPFSKIQGRNYFAQMAGVKIGFRKLYFRN